jgi:carbon monoxide dehydrogenase subunit G
MTINSVRNGGRTGTRRFLLSLAIVLSGTFSGGRLAATTGTPESAQVIVRENEGVYTVAAHFQVSQPPSIALSVLTDYEQIPRFMPGVTTSIVRERSEGRVVVEQEAVARMMMFSKRVHLLLEVREEGDIIRFRDSAGRSFTCYEGAWRLSQRDGQTVIRYELSAKPSFDVPEFLLKRLLRRDARQMIERLRAEIAARPQLT